MATSSYLGVAAATRCDARSASSAPQSARQTQLFEQLDHLETVLKAHEGGLDTLVARLQPVLRPAGPEGAGEKASPAALAPMAERLRGLAEWVVRMNSVAVDIIDRLEV